MRAKTADLAPFFTRLAIILPKSEDFQTDFHLSLPLCAAALSHLCRLSQVFRSGGSRRKTWDRRTPPTLGPLPANAHPAGNQPPAKTDRPFADNYGLPAHNNK
jgi:hypothetical protein